MAEHVGDASLFLLLSGQRPCFVLILKDLPGEEDDPEENELRRRYLVTIDSKWWPGTELNRRRQPFQGYIML